MSFERHAEGFDEGHRLYIEPCVRNGQSGCHHGRNVEDLHSHNGDPHDSDDNSSTQEDRSPAPSVVSKGSDRSNGPDRPNFSEVQQSAIQGDKLRSPVPSVVSMKSDQSIMGGRPFFSEAQQDTKVRLDRPKSPCSLWHPEEVLLRVATTSEMTDLVEKVLCAACPKRAAKLCLTCVANYCEIHVKLHFTAPALKKHKLVDVSTTWDQHLCDLHRRSLEFFCQTDQISICASCTVNDHRYHDVVQQSGNKTVLLKNFQRPPNKDIPPPGQVCITGIKTDAVSLKWECPEGQNGQPRFRVSWRCRLGTLQHSIDVKNTEVQIQCLVPGEEYVLSVATLSNDGGHSPWVSLTAFTEVPSPKNLTVETQLTSMLAKWKKPTGVAEVSYLLALSRDKESQLLYTDLEEHIFTDLNLDLPYTISVSTALSNAAQSKPVFKEFRTGIPIPENLNVGSVTTTSASLSWSMSSEMDEIPHSFLVSYHSKGAEPQTIITESCSVVITGLTPDTEHTVSIFTTLKDGRQGQPAVASIKTDILIPGNLAVGPVTATSASLSWSMPSEMDGIPHSFLVSYHSKGAEPQTITTESCSVVITGLTPGTEHTVSILTTLQDGRKGQPAVTAIKTGPRRSLAACLDLLCILLLCGILYFLLNDKMKKQDRYDDLEREYSQLQTQYNNVFSEKFSLQTQYDLLQDRYSQLQTQYNNVFSEKSSLQTQYDLLQDRYSKLQTQYNNVFSEKSSLQTQYDLLQDRYSQLQTQYNNVFSEKSSLQTQYDLLQDRYSQLQTQYNNVFSDKSSLQTQYDLLQDRYDSLTRGRSQLQERCDAITAERDTLLQRTVTAKKTIIQYAVDVTLDPDTAHNDLILSADGKQVKLGDTSQNRPDNPKRFDNYANVAGKQGFSSGRFFYEVQVSGKTAWYIGVARESVERKGETALIPTNGKWTIWLRDSEYKALAGPSVTLSLKEKPERVGVFVDYGAGLVSFYDADRWSLIYSYEGVSFREKIYPFFSPDLHENGMNSAPLVITPVSCFK